MEIDFNRPDSFTSLPTPPEDTVPKLKMKLLKSENQRMQLIQRLEKMKNKLIDANAFVNLYNETKQALDSAKVHLQQQSDDIYNQWSRLKEKEEEVLSLQNQNSNLNHSINQLQALVEKINIQLNSTQALNIQLQAELNELKTQKRNVPNQEKRFRIDKKQSKNEESVSGKQLENELVELRQQLSSAQNYIEQLTKEKASLMPNHSLNANHEQSLQVKPCLPHYENPKMFKQEKLMVSTPSAAQPSAKLSSELNKNQISCLSENELSSEPKRKKLKRNHPPSVGVCSSIPFNTSASYSSRNFESIQKIRVETREVNPQSELQMKQIKEASSKEIGNDCNDHFIKISECVDRNIADLLPSSFVEVIEDETLKSSIPIESQLFPDLSPKEDPFLEKNDAIIHTEEFVDSTSRTESSNSKILYIANNDDNGVDPIEPDWNMEQWMLDTKWRNRLLSLKDRGNRHRGESEVHFAVRKLENLNEINFEQSVFKLSKPSNVSNNNLIVGYVHFLRKSASYSQQETSPDQFPFDENLIVSFIWKLIENKGQNFYCSLMKKLGTSILYDGAKIATKPEQVIPLVRQFCWLSKLAGELERVRVLCYDLLMSVPQWKSLPRTTIEKYCFLMLFNIDLIWPMVFYVTAGSSILLRVTAAIISFFLVDTEPCQNTSIEYFKEKMSILLFKNVGGSLQDKSFLDALMVDCAKTIKNVIFTKSTTPFSKDELFNTIKALELAKLWHYEF